MDKKVLDAAIIEGLKIPMGPFPQQECGGVLTKKCRHCGGDVVMKGEGVPFEACSACGRKHYDPVYVT